ncbi:Mitochondrial glycoprotein [Actinidia chinensis var. chinensis]|uniref:Mitochondrial glycoprotein n=1 Tax=Actinidia chinensis var. chinensis TaxID=1590841 RepID=A0A2R6QZI0_ACTCC|nr:Mitochondrial glycoprotein [Actinidia chinensis var. chinensis]
MVGGGNRRDEGSLAINNTNVFAALETLRKKKKSDKDRGSSKSKGSSKSQGKEPEPQVFWAPTPLTTKSWADVDDEDDEDYYATTAPPPSVWHLSESDQTKEKQAPVEESESEEDLLDEGDEEVEEEHDQEPEEPIQAEPVVRNVPEVSSAPKETERQLSKKERKKKELAELEALLADFGVSPKVDGAQDESHDVMKDTKDGDVNEIGDGEKKENVPTESKGAKKKKKKDKSSKEVKESQDQPNGPEENAGAELAEEDASGIDVKERLKRMALAKKKKSNKELDTAARAAAIEAAARSARLAAAKKKEKNHYNQQPVR